MKPFIYRGLLNPYTDYPKKKQLIEMLYKISPFFHQKLSSFAPATIYSRKIVGAEVFAQEAVKMQQIYYNAASGRRNVQAEM